MKTNLLLFLFLGLLLSSCQKYDAGNTDISSNTYTVSWTYLDPSYYCEMNVPEITQDVVDNGAVFVYIQTTSGDWMALPCTLPIDGNYSSTYTPVHSLGLVRVFKTDTDLLTLDPGITTLKVVVVSEHGLAQKPDLDWTDYKQVAEEL
jgi:hypothetical protein